MTWQRIDENTYIDDTLVTCAEYQLFIDEMREQGNYYQPDHWTSFQFPTGQALAPILGVRYSDAVLFCEWLTQREDREWKFRLPTHEETNAFPMKPIGERPLGYWDDGNDNFIWIGSVPKNPRAINVEADIDIEFPNASFAIVFPVRAIETAPVRYIDFDRAHVLNLELAINLAHAVEHDDLFEFYYRAHIRDFNFKLNIDPNGARIRIFIHISGTRINGVYDFTRTDLVPNRIGYLYTDLFTLQERIAGRSPAFEGIRLVKERIK